ncbi:MAG: NADH:ubiquinone reductase (Na(+)-transporting) subunit B [Bacteroidia bacterium]|jgi:Na+-transporting NADH:ubiquinone oxidoreductase subunit B|nr:NADH:ubiquinone reductase (Na(+)-transporting) subunit B [Bacteroidota bacterium]
MDFLKKKILELRPDFEKGGKYAQFHTLFDGFATFLFTPDRVSTGGTHIKAGIDLKRTMFFVILAMVPSLLFGIFNVGHQHFLALGEFVGSPMVGFWDKVLYGAIKVLPIVVVSYTVGLGIEFFVASKKGHAINEGFLVSGMLIPLVLPPDIPLWMVGLATAFAVVFAKEVFGGTGMNVLNVALTARVFLFFAYPTFMSGDQVWISEKPDVYSGATALANAAATGSPFNISADQTWNYSLQDMVVGLIPGSIGETSKIAILLGAAFLILTGIGSGVIMLSVVLGALLMGLIFNGIGLTPFMNMPYYLHLAMGGLLFGAVFMATDPVTAAHTGTGKWIYGLLVGMMAVMIRVFNPAYPEGIMLAILFGNVMAPLIDYYVVQANIARRNKRLAGRGALA